MEKWIYDEEGQCIRCNDIPILEGSFNNKESEKALILATNAPQMLEMLQQLVDLPEQDMPALRSDIKQLIKEATTI